MGQKRNFRIFLNGTEIHTHRFETNSNQKVEVNSEKKIGCKAVFKRRLL